MVKVHIYKGLEFNTIKVFLKDVDLIKKQNRV